MFNELIRQKMKTDSGMRHGRGGAQRAEREGNERERIDEEEGGGGGGGGGGFSRKHLLLYYGCRIMCFLRKCNVCPMQSTQQAETAQWLDGRKTSNVPSKFQRLL